MQQELSNRETQAATAPIVSIRELTVGFRTEVGVVTAARRVRLEIGPGETVCIVGESGSGKSVTSLSLMRLVEFGGGRITGGTLDFARPDGSVLDLAGADDRTMRGIRGNEIGMIFQKPMTSLNPVFIISRQLTHGLRLYRGRPARRRASGRSRRRPRCVSPSPSNGWASTRTSCRGACASAS